MKILFSVSSLNRLNNTNFWILGGNVNATQGTTKMLECHTNEVQAIRVTQSPTQNCHSCRWPRWHGKASLMAKAVPVAANCWWKQATGSTVSFEAGDPQPRVNKVTAAEQASVSQSRHGNWCSTPKEGEMLRPSAGRGMLMFSSKSLSWRVLASKDLLREIKPHLPCATGWTSDAAKPRRLKSVSLDRHKGNQAWPEGKRAHVCRGMLSWIKVRRGLGVPPYPADMCHATLEGLGWIQPLLIISERKCGIELRHSFASSTAGGALAGSSPSAQHRGTSAGHPEKRNNVGREGAMLTGAGIRRRRAESPWAKRRRKGKFGWRASE